MRGKDFHWHRRTRIHCEAEQILDLEHESRVTCFAILFGRRCDAYVIPAAADAQSMPVVYR
jgi:hypothetical protein